MLAGRELWQLKHELLAYFRLLRRMPRDKPRVIIFAQGRTGSTLLESLLCSTGYFEERGEVLGAGGERILFPAAFLKGLARCPDGKGFICHVKPGHLARDRIAAGATPVDARRFLTALTNDGWRIIHLARANKLRQFISNRMAEARGAYHKRDERAEIRTVTVDRKQLEDDLRVRQAMSAAESAALQGLPVHHIEYEKDLEQPLAHQATVNGVLEFLGLERRAAASELRKINTRPIREMIANYDEFARWATELGWSSALDGD